MQIVIFILIINESQKAKFLNNLDQNSGRKSSQLHLLIAYLINTKFKLSECIKLGGPKDPFQREMQKSPCGLITNPTYLDK